MEIGLGRTHKSEAEWGPTNACTHPGLSTNPTPLPPQCGPGGAPILSPQKDFSSPALAAAAEDCLAPRWGCGAEEAGRQWLQGRKLPSLTPASSPHGGITCSSLLGLPSCSALPAVRQLWSEPCRSEIVLKLCFYQCTAASSVETIAALIVNKLTAAT